MVIRNSRVSERSRIYTDDDGLNNKCLFLFISRPRYTGSSVPSVKTCSPYSDGGGELVVVVLLPPTVISTPLKRDGVGIVNLRGRQDGLITTSVGF